ncbi:MAG: hypothetical protein ABR530_04905 [Pyrinomonadaceae bacterium]
MPQPFQPGDFIVFQLESGFALLRVLEIEDSNDSKTWHIAAYNEFFPDVESAEQATITQNRLSIATPHIALTNRAFESTQVARVSNSPLSPDEAAPLQRWHKDPNATPSDRSVRLLLGLR